MIRVVVSRGYDQPADEAEDVDGEHRGPSAEPVGDGAREDAPKGSGKRRDASCRTPEVGTPELDHLLSLTKPGRFIFVQSIRVCRICQEWERHGRKAQTHAGSDAGEVCEQAQEHLKRKYFKHAITRIVADC